MLISRYLILRFYTDSNPGQLPQKSGVCASILGHHIISTFSFVLIQKSKKKFIWNSQNFKDILQGFNNEKDKETLEKHGFFLTLKTLKEKNRLFLCEKMKYFSSIFSCTAQKLLVKWGRGLVTWYPSMYNVHCT